MNGGADEPIELKLKGLILDWVAKTPFPWPFPKSLDGKSGLLKILSVGILNVPNRLFVVGLGIRTESGILKNGLSVAEVGLGTVSTVILTASNGPSFSELGVGAVLGSLNSLNGLFAITVAVGTVSSILVKPKEPTVVGFGIGAVPKSMGRVEDSEVLGTTYPLPITLGNPKRGLVWLLLDMLKRLFGGVLAVFESIVVALGTPKGLGLANRLLEASEVVNGLKAPVVVALGTPKGPGPANRLLEVSDVVVGLKAPVVVVLGRPKGLGPANKLLEASEVVMGL